MHAIQAGRVQHAISKPALMNVMVEESAWMENAIVTKVGLAIIVNNKLSQLRSIARIIVRDMVSAVMESVSASMANILVQQKWIGSGTLQPHSHHDRYSCLGMIFHN